MRKVTKLITVLVLLFTTMLALTVTVGAGMGGFSVNPVMPPNQKPETSGFFDLQVTPGQNQELTFTVSNSESKDISVLISPITATTNLHGDINYNDPGLADETLKYSFAEMVEFSDDTLVIPANSSKDVTMYLAVPEESFDGIILGSITVLKALTDEEMSAGGMLVNEYKYVMAVRLQMTDTPVDTEFLMGDVTAELVNGRASIIADIRNPQPRITREVEAHAQIYPRGSDTPIFELTKENVGFAPNSVFPFTLTDEAGYGLQAGFYIAKIQLAHEGKTWEFEHEFEIKPEEAANINRNAVNQLQQQAPIMASGGLSVWVIASIAAGVLLVVILIVLLVKKSADNRREYELFQQKMIQLENKRRQPDPEQSQQKDSGQDN